MTNFWTISLFWASLLVLVGVALAFVLPPLLRRETKPGQEVDAAAANIAIYHDQLAELKADLDSGELDAPQYEDAKREIEKRLSEDVPRGSPPPAQGRPARWVGYTLAGIFPVLAIAFYLLLGNPQALSVAPAANDAASQGQHDAAPMIAALEARLKKNPDDAAGWYMLARSYATIGKFHESARAFEKVAALLPEDSGILADYADVLAMTQGGNLQGKPLELIHKALKLNANDEKALDLAGTAAYENGDFSEAARYWRQLLKLVPPDSDISRKIAAAVKEAEISAKSSGRSNPSGPAGKGGGEKPGQAAQIGQTISGTVTVSKDLNAKVGASDTVFIYAQAPQGSKMPIASLKVAANELPYRFILDDSSAMAPSDKLSNHAEVMVSARISKSGDAMARSGDLQGRVGLVKLGQQGISIVIDSVLP
ncbi:MAG: c-type cytochrome biogenesis protein CcmI [Betaproteobacteria bacterium]